MNSKASSQLRAATLFPGRIMLLFAAAGTFGLVAYRASGWWHSLQPIAALALVAGGIVASLALAYVAWHAHVATVHLLIREIALIGVVMVATEIWLIHSLPEGWTQDKVAQNYLLLEKAAKKLGVPFDPRTISEVVEDLRKTGADALPALARSWPRASELRKSLPKGLFPLSDASNAQIVECNESGQYFVFKTDELGFNNPPGLVASGNVDVAVVGESHALGHCVPYGQGFVDRVRQTIPRTANFALSYTFALSELGSFREYVEPLKPRIVLWVISTPLAVTSGGEGDNPILRHYLDPYFSQHLTARQAEVDAVVRAGSRSVQAAEDHVLQEELARARRERYSQFYALHQVRSRLDLSRAWQQPPPPPDTTMLERSLRLADATTRSWGGKLVVMVLPTYGEVVGEQKEAIRHHLVVDVIRKLGVDYIDTAELFLTQPDVRGLFAMRMSNHPNERGHALLGRRVAQELEKRLHPSPERLTSEKRL